MAVSTNVDCQAALNAFETIKKDASAVLGAPLAFMQALANFANKFYGQIESEMRTLDNQLNSLMNSLTPDPSALTGYLRNMLRCSYLANSDIGTAIKTVLGDIQADQATINAAKAAVNSWIQQGISDAMNDLGKKMVATKLNQAQQNYKKLLDSSGATSFLKSLSDAEACVQALCPTYDTAMEEAFAWKDKLGAADLDNPDVSAGMLPDTKLAFQSSQSGLAYHKQQISAFNLFS